MDFFKIRGSKEQSKATLLYPILGVGPAVFEYAEAVRVTPVNGPCAASLQSRRLSRGCECGRYRNLAVPHRNFQLFQFLVSQHQVPER